MDNSLRLLAHENVSVAATQKSSSLCGTSLNTTRYLLCTDRHRARKLFPSILHGVGTGGQPIGCDLPRAGHRLSFSHGPATSRRNHTRRSPSTHGKPASHRHPAAKKRTQTQKEAEIKEALLKHEPARPSEDCIARLFEQQPLRLQNSSATFHCRPQEANTVTHKASRMEIEKSLLYTKGNSKGKSVNGDVKLNPEFSVKLLDILASFNRNNEFSDAKFTGVIDSQPLETKSREDAMQGRLQSNVFFSFESQIQPTVEMERPSRIVDETSSKGTQLAAPTKDERSSCGMLASSRKDILDSPSECKGPQDNQSAFEESGFSSESSDDDNYRRGNRQAIDKLENVSLQHANEPFKHKARQLSESVPVSYGKGWSHVFPWHLSRSTGSRSSPSRSSIPGLRSKYSKPDPKAKQQLKKPLQLLSNVEEKTDLIHRSVLEAEDEEDDVTLQTFQKDHKQPETELKDRVKFDWWDSDDEDDFKCGLSTSTKLPTVINVESSLKNPKMEPQLNGEAKDSGSSRPFEKSYKPIDEENISFEWSDLNEEDDLKIKDDIMFEWSDSDAEDDLDAKEKSFKSKNKDPEHDFDKDNATSPIPVSFEIEGKSTWPITSVGTSNLSSSSDQALACHTPTDYPDSGLNSSYKCNLFVGATQKANNDGLHQLPASVKFVEPPSWKSPIFPDFPFEINYSYSETPKVPVLGFRDHLSPFSPKTMDRPWTGGAHIKPRRHEKSIESFNRELERKKAFELTFNRKCKASKQLKSREEILGKPLTKEEIIRLVQNCHEENRQVNLGRDGLTHNMIHLIHTHWKKRPVCKIKCRGVPTLDIDNVCFHVEDKTGGQIIYRSGGIVYVFRGRNYVFGDRPVMPFMLFRPASPVYPKLVPQAPAGLTIDEAHQLRILGQKVKPLLELGKNAVLLDLVRDVRDAFQVDELVSLYYGKIKPCDYRKIGAKLMELVPCVLLSFRNNRIVLWKGRDLKASTIVGPESCADSARLDGEPTDVEGSCSPEDGCSFSQPDEQSIDSMQHVSKESTPLHHLDKDSESEANLMDSLDLNSEHWHTKIQPPKAAKAMVLVVGNDNLAGGNTRDEMLEERLLEPQFLGDIKAPEPQFLGDIKVPSDVPAISDDLLVSQNKYAELCAGGGGITSGVSHPNVSGTYLVNETAICKGDDSTLSGGAARSDQGDQSRPPPGGLDDLWEVALNNGMAAEIKDIDLEADLILHKVTHFSEVAPAGSEYTSRLVNRLRLFGLYKKTQKPFVVPLNFIRRKDRAIGRKNRPIKRRVAKRASRSPKIETPPRKGLQTDDLVKKLRCI